MRKFRRSSGDRNKREPYMNERIRALKIRLLIDGQAPMIVDRNTALRKAEELGLDLIEVSPNQDPPVCRIIDYGKYKFEQKKRKQEQARHQHNFSIKEVKLRPKIAIHDYDLKKRNASTFLQHGDKVKVTVRFRGREAAHPELGMNLMRRMAEDLKELSIMEVPARQEGRQINMVLAPQTKLRKETKKEPSVKIKEDSKDKNTSVPSSVPSSVKEEKKESKTEKTVEKAGTQNLKTEKTTEKAGTQEAKTEKTTEKAGTQEAKIEKTTEKAGTQEAKIERTAEKAATQEAKIEKTTEKAAAKKTKKAAAKKNAKE